MSVRCHEGRKERNEYFVGQERVKLKLWPCINPTHPLVGNLREETEILRKQTAVGAGAFTPKCYELSKALFLC